MNAASVLMFVGAGLEAISVVFELVGNASGASVFGGLMGTLLWIKMATANRAGKSWARILSTVFFGLATVIDGLAVAAVASVATDTAIYEVVLAFTWTMSQVIIILLWSRPSSRYFAAMR